MPGGPTTAYDVRLQVQPPAPGAVLGGEQTVGEPQQVGDPPIEDPGPGVAVVDHRRASSSAGSTSRGSSTRSRRASGARTTDRRPSVVCTWSVRTKSTSSRGDHLDHPIQMIAGQPVVAIEVGQVATRGSVESLVARGRQPDRRGRCAAPADPAAGTRSSGRCRPWRRAEPSSTTITSSAAGSPSCPTRLVRQSARWASWSLAGTITETSGRSRAGPASVGCSLR